MVRLKTFADLFCGIGGFRYGLEACGMECVFSADIDEAARANYLANHGVTPAGDITKLDPRSLPEFDVLTGGFPCQAFSMAGKRQGTADPRGTLFWEAMKIIKRRYPKVVFMENVKGLVTERFRPTFESMLDCLDKAGYTARYAVLNAAHFGIPQSRERVYIIGLRKDLPLMWKVPLPTYKPCRLADVLEPEDSIPERYYLSDDAVKGLVRHKVKQAAKGNGFGLQLFDKEMVFGTVMTADHSNLKLIRVGEVGDPTHRQNRVYSDQGAAITQAGNAGGGGAKTGLYETNGRIRKLTPREAHRLQGFPDTHRLTGSEAQQYKQAGNAVIPRMIELVWRGVKAT